MWKRNSRELVSIVALIFFLMLGPVVAQDLTSRVEGTLQDQTGGILPGVEVKLVNVETNVERIALTNDNGLYVFPQVAQGKYRIVAAMAGFKTAVVEGVVIEVGIPGTVNMKLEIGEISDQVVVNGSQSQAVINTVNAEINTVISREQIQVLPLNGRSVTELALLQAGVTGGGSIAREASVNGTRGTFNNLLLDGINNQDNFVRTDAFFGVIPLRESFVEEFNLTTSNSESDAGLGVSQTMMVTRGGTNRYHGEAFYYHRNDALNANGFFNNSAGLSKERVRNHQYGGNVGGPILKDKLFFFVNYEEERDPGTVSVARQVLVPGARQGEYSYLRQDNGQRNTVNLLTLTGVTIDPAIKKLIDLAPSPNDATVGDGYNISGFRFNSPARQDQDWLVLRVDFEPNPRHSISGTFHQFRYDFPNDPNNDIDARFPGLTGAGQKSTRRLGAYSWRYTPTATLTNESRFGFQYAPVKFFTEETFKDGYKIRFSDPNLGEIDLIENPVQTFDPQGRTAPVYEFADNASLLKGDHTFRFGGGARWVRVDLFNTIGVVPEYYLGFGAGNPDPLEASLFPGGVSANDLGTASELLSILGGYVDSARQTFNVTSPTSGFVKGADEARLLKQNIVNFFAADTWRIRPSVTLNFGLRWEFHGVPGEANGLALLPTGPAGAVLDPNATVDFAGAGTGRTFFQNDWNNLAPQVGIAWKPFGDPKTVLRAGFGLNYVIDNNMTTVRNALAGNDGLSQGVYLTGLTGTVSGGGITPVPVPTFEIPRTARDGILMDPTAALFTIDPDLRVPYVQQWNIGIQREILPDLGLEVRYVGNHGVKLSRAVDLNQPRFPQEFIDDFRRAQRNLAANGDPRVGETLTVFAKLGLGGYLQAASVRTMIRNGEIGQYVGGFLAPNRAVFFAGEGGEELGATLPIGYFLPNPNAFVADVVENNAFSKYNALQVELRRRFRNGFTGQLNYTFGKALTNFAGSQTNFRGYFDNQQQQLEILRPDYDITHTCNANFVWQIPVGHNRNIGVHRYLDPVIGGWDLSGIVRARSGETINIVSERGTINRGGSRATTNTVHLDGLTIPELQKKTGLFQGPGGRILLFDPSLIGPDGRASTEYFHNPGLLEAGTLGLSPVSGPWYSTVDLGVRKSFRLPLSESSLVQLRFDVFNVFNRVNFNVATQPVGARGNDQLGVVNRQNINSTDFGLIDSTFAAREMQVGLKINF